MLTLITCPKPLIEEETRKEESITDKEEEGVKSVKEGILSKPFWVLYFLATFGASKAFYFSPPENFHSIWNVISRKL